MSPDECPPSVSLCVRQCQFCAEIAQRLISAVRRSLEELHLRFNKIKELPGNMCHLREMRKLDLRDNELVMIPGPAIERWVQLEELFMSNNKLASLVLPPALRGCIKLKHLELRENVLEHVPVEIGSLCNLERLNLSKNKITSVPGEVPAGLVKLKELFLADNKIAGVLPPEMGAMTQLRILSLSNNKITALPPELGNCTEIEELWIVKNSLKEVPETIRSWSKCQEIILRDNKPLKKLPEGISFLPKLRELDLRGTKCSLDRQILLLHVQAYVRGGVKAKKKKKK